MIKYLVILGILINTAALADDRCQIEINLTPSQNDYTWDIDNSVRNLYFNGGGLSWGTYSGKMRNCQDVSIKIYKSKNTSNYFEGWFKN